MSRHITRRDFLNGTQVAIGASLLSPWVDVFGKDLPGFTLPADYYPPAKTGLRGSHEGAWEAMHARVAGGKARRSEPGERYDLVVAGGGISGLAAAWFWRQRHPGARILVLDNHDDFGGHAKRNEFRINGDTRIGYGGTESIDTPSSYSAVAQKLLRDIGIDVAQFFAAFDQTLYPKLGLGKGILFDSATFGKQRLATGYQQRDWEDFVMDTPLSEQARKDLVRVWTEERDYLPDLSQEEKARKLRRVSYETFLRDYAKLDPQLIEMYRRWGISFWCVGIDEIPASDVQSYDGGMPGLDHTLTRIGSRGDEPYIFHFPDGNASIARLLVRSLLPAAMPGNSMEDVVTARASYAALDRPGNDTRIRLSSTVVEAINTTDGRHVDVTYARAGRHHTVRADHCILACYNAAVPYLCPEVSAKQRECLAYAVKTPITYTKVLVPNWRALADQGLDFVYYTNGFYKQVELDYPVSLGGYKRSQTPDDPMVLHMCHVPFVPEIKGPGQWREGRMRLLSTPFATFEHHVRDQLDQALGSAGFDAGRDIHAITVNRWPHGYAYSPHLIWEPDWKEGEEPWVVARQQIGRIAIANSDAGATATTDAAIDQAWRAVSELRSVSA